MRNIITVFVFLFSALCFYISWADTGPDLNHNYPESPVDFEKKDNNQIQLPVNDGISLNEMLIRNDLDEAKSKILMLEMKLKKIEAGITRKYPNVIFLNHTVRKRILVSISCCIPQNNLFPGPLLYSHL